MINKNNSLKSLEDLVRTGSLKPAPIQGTKEILGHKEISKIPAYDISPIMQTIKNININSIHKIKKELYEIDLVLKYINNLDLTPKMEGHVARLLTPKITYEKKIKELTSKEFKLFKEAKEENNYNIAASIIKTDKAFENMRSINKENKITSYNMVSELERYDSEYIQRINLNKKITNLEILANRSSKHERNAFLKKIEGTTFKKGLFDKCKKNPEGRDRLNKLVNYLNNIKTDEEIKLEQLNKTINQVKKQFKYDKDQYEEQITTTTKEKINLTNKYNNKLEELTESLLKTTDENNYLKENLINSNNIMSKLTQIEDKLSDTNTKEEIKRNNESNLHIVTEKLTQIENNIEYIHDKQETNKELVSRIKDLETKNYLKEEELKKEKEEPLQEYIFSLPGHMLDIGFPTNYDFQPLRRLLFQKTADNSWTTTFSEVDKFIEKGKQNNLDFKEEQEYLSLVSYGLKKAIEEPTDSFDCIAARKTYHNLLQVLT